jgi:hypothetical protein
MTHGAPCTIAITGHRPNRLHVGVHRIERQLFQVLRRLRREARGRAVPRRPVALTALAEGSDRMFAEAALRLALPLEVLLPFKSSDYETTFGDQAATAQYHALLARAARVTELPGALSDSSAAYEAVGRACVNACDVLVAVWDGKPAAGRGGTPEIIEYARNRGRRIIWIHAGEKRRPRRL